MQVAALQQLASLGTQINSCQATIEKILAKSGGDWSKLSGSDKQACERALGQWNGLEQKVQKILAPGPAPRPTLALSPEPTQATTPQSITH